MAVSNLRRVPRCVWFIVMVTVVLLASLFAVAVEGQDGAQHPSLSLRAIQRGQAVLESSMIISYRTRDHLISEEFTMAASHKRSFSLPSEQARYIDNLVASGTYATSSEVIRAGLRALQERDAAVERWLREEVVPVAAAMQAEPGRTISADRVFGEIRALHARRLKNPASDA